MIAEIDRPGIDEASSRHRQARWWRKPHGERAARRRAARMAGGKRRARAFRGTRDGRCAGRRGSAGYAVRCAAQISALETRIAEQDEALRGFLDLLIEWVERDPENAPNPAKSVWAA